MNLSYTETHRINDLIVTKTIELTFEDHLYGEMADKFDALVDQVFEDIPGEPDKDNSFDQFVVFDEAEEPCRVCGSRDVSRIDGEVICGTCMLNGKIDELYEYICRIKEKSAQESRAQDREIERLMLMIPAEKIHGDGTG